MIGFWPAALTDSAVRITGSWLTLRSLRQLFNSFPGTSVERGMWTSQPRRSRWHIAARQSRIDAMDRRGERRNYRNRKDSCEDRQSHIVCRLLLEKKTKVSGQNILQPKSRHSPRGESS